MGTLNWVQSLSQVTTWQNRDLNPGGLVPMLGFLPSNKDHAAEVVGAAITVE